MYSENPKYLSDQIITYLGNKRSLLQGIGNVVNHVSNRIKKDKLVTFDGFSGSGIVARYLKQSSSLVVANDLEDYSRIINLCYLANPTQEMRKEIQVRIESLNREASSLNVDDSGLFRRLYSPQDANRIQPGERVFYTPENARRIDFYAQKIREAPVELQPYLYAPLLYKASVHVNTSGVFKGFHKNAENIGQFGGRGRIALSRIMQPIELPMPIFSNFTSDFQVYQDDTTIVAQKMPQGIDLTYLDPPYNQHPYGSNYFMLNLILRYEEPEKMSNVSGIPDNWNRSAYNKKALALTSMQELLESLDSKFIAISYNNEGFIQREEFVHTLSTFGSLEIYDTVHPTYKGSRNLSQRAKNVTETIYLLEKK